MDFVLDYDDTAVVRLVGDQLVCSLELNVVAVVNLIRLAGSGESGDAAVTFSISSLMTSSTRCFTTSRAGLVLSGGVPI